MCTLHHKYPDKLLRKIEVATCSHLADCPLGTWCLIGRLLTAGKSIILFMMLNSLLTIVDNSIVLCISVMIQRLWFQTSVKSNFECTVLLSWTWIINIMTCFLQIIASFIPRINICCGTNNFRSPIWKRAQALMYFQTFTLHPKFSL